MTVDLTADVKIEPLKEKPRVIGLWAPAPECGKSTVANEFALRLGYKRTAFAEPLKRMLITLLVEAGYSIPDAERLVWTDKSEPLVLLPGAPTSRHLQRTLGTEWGRDLVHEDLWAIIWKNKDRHLNRVVDDIRMPNEYSAVRTSEGPIEIWAVIRPGYVDTSGHRSELGLGEGAKFDRVIYNDGSIQDLIKKTRVLMSEVL